MSNKKTVSNINLKTFYGDENSSPGNFPYKSGIYPDMYSEKLWTMRQYSGFASTEESNKRYIELLAKGAKIKVDPRRYRRQPATADFSSFDPSFLLLLKIL